MKKYLGLYSILFCFLLSHPASSEGMEKLGQAGMTFLSLGGSARAAAMANVFGFAKNDLGSVFHNPAGLASVDGTAIFLSNTSWIDDINVIHVALSYNAGDYGVFGLTLQTIDYGEFNGTTMSDTDPRGYTDIDVGDVSGLAVGVAYGIQMTDNFFIGGGIKLVSQQLGMNDIYVAGAVDETGKENKASTIAYDFGTIYDTGLRSLQLTMSIRNYSAQVLYENEEFQLPQTYRIGISANMFEMLPFGNEGGNSLILAVEGVDHLGRNEYLNAGLEYTLLKLVDLRAGYAFERAQDDTGGLSAGIGINLAEMNLPFNGRLDIAYSDYGNLLGSVMQFSIQGSF